MDFPDDTAPLPWRLHAADARRSCRPSPIEVEVQALFLSFGLPPADALFQHVQRGKPRDIPGGWLFRVAHNQGVKHRKCAQRDARMWTKRPPLAEDLAADPALNPEDRALNSQTQGRVCAVIVLLPEQERRCFALRPEGLRYHEIAQVLDISLGSVSVSLARVAQRCRT